MTQEDKELLLKDLCARLPYKVKCYAYQYKIDGNHCECYGVLEGMRNGYFHLIDKVSVNGGKTYDSDYLEVKPYLRPMSSMTEEERKHFESMCCWGKWESGPIITLKAADWLNENHFDYRWLIEKSLALVAPENMY